MQTLRAARAARDASSAVSGAGVSVAQSAGGGADADDDKSRKKSKEKDKEEESDPEDGSKGAESSARKRAEPQVWEWLDDLLEGFAELYRRSVGAGQQCHDCVRRTAYPIKQRLVAGYDTAAPNERAQRQQRRAGATTATFSMD
mmetsp:Transcript_50086/g.119164  ORF Transcript_50086/g.119164 Transcript_50086/m.119164 type:complete len:144 (-) Transcript_50086:195-626(-)